MYMNGKGYQVHGNFFWRKWSWRQWKYVNVAEWKALDAQGHRGEKAERTYYRNKMAAIQALRRIQQLNSIPA